MTHLARILRRHPAGPVLIALSLVALLGACEDDPFAIDWPAAPDTVLLYSLARPELGLESAFNFNARQPVRIEAPTATGNWDLALDTQGDDLVFLPPGAFNINSRARVTALPGLAFDDVLEAPADTTLYSATAPVTVKLNTVYVVRTSQTAGSFGQPCVYYAKLEPLVIDVEAGTLEFVYDGNPVCNDPRLVPPGD